MTARKATTLNTLVKKKAEKKPVAKVVKTTSKATKKTPAKTSKPVETLKNAKTILLIDWPDKSVPLALLKAGFMVIGYSPDKYTLISYETSYAEDKLVFSVLEGTPGQVEIVNIFRPEEEHEEIINQHAIPFKAKTIWLHPPITSAKTAKLARKHQLSFVEGHDITATAVELNGSKINL